MIKLKPLVEEVSKDKLYIMKYGNTYTLWTSYSPGGGRAQPIKNFKTFFTDKSSDSHFSSAVKDIIDWQKKNVPFKQNKDKTRKLYKVPLFNSNQFEDGRHNYELLSIWGGDIKPERNVYMLIVNEKNNIVQFFEKAGEANAWVQGNF